MTGARIFVGVLFTLLGAAFIASSAILITDLRGSPWLPGDGWVTMVVTHSNLFLFFPVLGVLALIAFYLPAVIFTHLYWNYLPAGKLRFILGIIAVVAATYYVDRYLDQSPRALWELSSSVIGTDAADPPGCTGDCKRAAIPGVLADLRKEAQLRVGISKYARSCATNDLVEEREEMKALRYCFPARAKLDGRACCEVQQAFSRHVDSLQADPTKRSRAALYDRIFMPLKIFFVLVVVAIGCLLAMWRDRVDAHYAQHAPAMERGVIIGAFAMLFWPAMDYAYLSATNVMFGHAELGPQFRLSLVIAPWTLLLLFYFLRRLGKQGEIIGQISGVVAAGVAVLRYEELNDWATKLLGVGMPMWVLGAILAFAVAGLFGLFWPWKLPETPGRADAA